MLIIGTGGLASDIVSSMQWDKKNEKIVLFNDTEVPDFNYLSENFQILRDKKEAIHYLQTIDNRFIVGIGDNKMRKIISEQLEQVGGVNENYISDHAFINEFATIGNKGVIILGKTIVANSVKIGNGSILYTNSNLAHGVEIGEYCLLSASVSASDVNVGDFSFIGIGASLKPGITIQQESIIGIGAVVIENTDMRGVYVGNPAKNIKIQP